ncbi:MAG: GNAT family N-acetyltransferase, partial [Pseudomonadota bacterium]
MQMQTIVNQPTIETDRFDLRPLRRSDLGLIALHTGDKRVAQNTASIP